MSAEPRVTPAVVLWAMVYGSAGVGTIDLAIQSSRLGGDVVSVGLGLFAASLPGLALGLVLAGAFALVAPRLPDWARTLPSAATAAAVALVCAAAAPLGFWAIERGLTAYHAHPLKSRSEEAPVVAALFFFLLLVAAPLAFAAIRRIATYIQNRDGDSYWVAGASLVLLAVMGGWQVQGDPGSSTQFPWFLPLGLVLLWTVGGAYMVGASTVARPMSVRVQATVVLVVGVLGFVGLHRDGTRALLFHDARVFERVFRAELGLLDRDGDRDFPAWLGWGDCDNGDPAVSSLHAEIPGNGVDDNCHGGDRAVMARERPPTVAGPRPPVIVITIDTLMASHLELHGYARQTAPNLTALAQRGRWFERAYAPANHTFLSMMPILSGQSVERLGVAAQSHDFTGLKFSAWLPHELRKLGYLSLAVAPPVRYLKMQAEDLRFDTIDPVSRGVETFNVNLSSRPIVDTAISHIKAHTPDAPLLMWVHLLDPHAFHEAPPVFEGSAPTDRYDNEIAWTDEQLGRLLTAVSDRWGDQAIVVVTSDHGEQFGELGFHGHGWSLREREIHVPLVIAGPGIETGRVAEPVSVTSVLPTILAALGQAHNPKLSASSVASGVPAEPVLVFSPDEGRLAVALLEGPWKLIRNRGSATSLLFNLEQDPRETTNLVHDEAQRHAAMLERMRELLEAEP